MTQKRLYYVHDPMCSWCWAFEPTRQRLFEALDGRVEIRRLLGGLAPDTDLPMPPEMRQMLQQTWQRIQHVVPGTEFNFDFWRDNQPRRSTYPANRAVIAARRQGDQYDASMTARIQRAYYLEAKNPSDDEVLIDLAGDLGLDAGVFAADLAADSTRQRLLDEIRQGRALGIDSFPSLALETPVGIYPIGLDYLDAGAMLRQIEAR